MAFSITGENAHYGHAVECGFPWTACQGLVEGGSAAAVAARLIGTFAIGSDTSGSVRLSPRPCTAAYTALSPDHGRITVTGACPHWHRASTQR
jgi:Asp-tRNA(Asn)/Glu-tRNA(Gln) amidotransferase A subunit family amidase